MGVDVAHFVLEAEGDANDKIVDDGLDGAQGSYSFTRAVVEFDVDKGSRGLREADGKM